MSVLNQRIREYLETQTAPVSPKQVSAALEANPQHVRNALATMRHAGLVLYDHYSGYKAGGRKPMSRKEAAALGGEARKAQCQVKPAKPRSISLTPRRLQMTEAAPERIQYPSTEDFIKANPDKVIRLPAGVWSQPLQFDY